MPSHQSSAAVSSDMNTSNFVSGLTAPLTNSIDALKIDHFVPTRDGHPPPGSIPDSILPQGVSKPALFQTITLPFAKPEGGKMTFKNRVIVSPMCQYSAEDGLPTPYHIAHLGSFALHGVGNVMVEASGVTPEGRITPQDVGLWSERHRDAHKALVSVLKSFTDGLGVGVQLAHAGRKASDWSPFYRGEKREKYVTREEGGWPEDVVAPSAIPYTEGSVTPRALTLDEIKKLEESFVQSARWAFEAGYDYVELHGAHGYLMHSFLSPLTNHRTDDYGGSLENRTRFMLNIARRIRAEFPQKGLWVRVSSTDWAENAGHGDSWTPAQTVELAKMLQDAKVDLLDVSSGGLVPFQQITLGAGYQLFGAKAVKDAIKQLEPEESKRMLVGAVGMMEGSHDSPNGQDRSQIGRLAEKSIVDGECDAVLLARGLMSYPSWTEDAAVALTGVRAAGNPQYHRVHPAKK
ncbi:NADH:flavin oxidoreductase/NADH oxidase, N-terminal [Kalmanozyma brasiliensis GHG001]|uniref:NADH:flavin oxidoreductase n=1 Tax=Kalmanozyma brasiliensis (strain GHG001) TaxID=1365824 RepID=V5F083_KALBG|nr:NADH:flavin oxidoreductase/NADH oxidase, N-terminal [Kalmanozyma brasiliensis GHG001]EST09683.1 NADH:flavin oxidoreductase/NADH oxidase, N-terminal [Kalmanozyma brasiliensis GHG001]